MPSLAEVPRQSPPLTEKTHPGQGEERAPLSQQVHVSGGQWGKGPEEAVLSG